jgi:hypothetical protein
MSWKTEELLNEIRSVLDLWDLMAKRYPFSDEPGPKKWTKEDAKRNYGTWTDEQGREKICQSAAEKTLAKAITVIEEHVDKTDREIQKQNFEIRHLKDYVKRVKKFASMNDRELGKHMERHVRALKEEEGEEDLIHCPDWYEFIAKRLNP